MRFPISLHVDMTKYLLGNALKGLKRFPLVLMLEPTHRCNLQCTGCGRIREYRETLAQEMSLEECVGAVEECGAPVVTITGGEPLLYSQVGPLVKEVLARKKHIYLCTNGVLLERSLHLFRPSPRFTFNVHLDGPREVHDSIIGTPGTFERAMEGIRAAKKQGFRVTTNTTIYKETEPEKLELLFHLLAGEKVDGLLVAPAYHYQAVEEGIFLAKEEIVQKFSEIEAIAKKYKIISTPLYMDFLMGRRKMLCTPWGNPHAQPRRLEVALLPHHRHPLLQFPGAHGKNSLGQIRQGRRSQVSPLHDALRIRAHCGKGAGPQSAGSVAHDHLEPDLKAGGNGAPPGHLSA